MIEWLKKAAIVLAVAGIAFLAIGTAIANWGMLHPSVPNQPPAAGKAAYELTVANTNMILYTNRYSKAGAVHTMDGYWQSDGKRYRYHQGPSDHSWLGFGRAAPPLELDESVFGKITVRRR